MISAWHALAHALATDPPDTDIRLGDVRLLPHQREAVAQLQATLTRRRIALLADATGLGKTYVACALSAESQHPLVVAPAAVRQVWRDAERRTGVRMQVESYEVLSQGRRPDIVPDFVILDEAHHARSPNSARWRALATLCRSARVLLISATPIHNRPADLVALLALVLGDDASGSAGTEVLRTAVRRQHDDIAGATSSLRMPEVAPWQWHKAPETPDVGRLIDALPPAVAPSDGAESAPLWRIGLVRAWASSDAALLGAIRRRMARGLALQQALRDGHRLSRAELHRWTRDDLVAPLLPLDLDYLQTARPRSGSANLDAVGAHLDGLKALAAHVRAQATDSQRTALLLATLDAAPLARMVCFTSYAATAEWYWQGLRHLPGVALVTGRGGRIASGVVPRDEIFAALERDGPATRHAREQIRVLITTDVASEGLTLTAASIVWHADLPWTPARLAQRTGRLARLGSPHATVMVHAFTPPGGTDATLALPRRLADKARHSALVGRDDPRLSGIGAEDDLSPAAATVALRRLAAERIAARGRTLHQDTDPAAVAISTARVAVTVLEAPTEGMVAVLGPPPATPLWTFAELTNRAAPDAASTAAWQLLKTAAPDDVATHQWSPDTRRAVRRARERVRRACRVASTIGQSIGTSYEGFPAGAEPPRTTMAARALLRRVADALRNAAPPDRPRVAALAAALRRRLAQPIAAGWHRPFMELASAPDSADWWSQVSTLLSQLDAAPTDVPLPIVRAIFVLVPPADRR